MCMASYETGKTAAQKHYIIVIISMSQTLHSEKTGILAALGMPSEQECKFECN